MIVRISDDALASALGADELALAFANKGHEVHRTSSWGMHWLEPLVEIDGTGFGPATLADVDAILDGSSPKSIGRIEDHPFIAKQQRLTFARAGKTRSTSLEDYEATGGWAGAAAGWAGAAGTDAGACALASRARSAVRRSSRKSPAPACAAAAAPASRRASSGRPWRARRARRNTASATPTKASPAPSPTAWSWKAIPTH